jgi:hypothetical protein
MSGTAGVLQDGGLLLVVIPEEVERVGIAISPFAE